MANSEWLQQFPKSSVEHLVRNQSDHCPVWIIWNKRACFSRRKRKPFRFEAMWLQDESCPAIIQEAWSPQSIAACPSEWSRKINKVAAALKSWDRDHFGRVSSRIELLRNNLLKLQTQQPSSRLLAQMKAIENELRNLLQREETMWKQRSRANWLTDGDKNTSFFHKMASGRHKRNAIEKVMNHNNHWEVTVIQ